MCFAPLTLYEQDLRTHQVMSEYQSASIKDTHDQPSKQSSPSVQSQQAPDDYFSLKG